MGTVTHRPEPKVDVTHVRRGQLAALAARPAHPSEKALTALARVSERRK